MSPVNRIDLPACVSRTTRDASMAADTRDGGGQRTSTRVSRPSGITSPGAIERGGRPSWSRAGQSPSAGRLSGPGWRAVGVVEGAEEPFSGRVVGAVLPEFGADQHLAHVVRAHHLGRGAEVIIV